MIREKKRINEVYLEIKDQWWACSEAWCCGWLALSMAFLRYWAAWLWIVFNLFIESWRMKNLLG